MSGHAEYPWPRGGEGARASPPNHGPGVILREGWGGIMACHAPRRGVLRPETRRMERAVPAARRREDRPCGTAKGRSVPSARSGGGWRAGPALFADVTAAGANPARAV
ncbi:hypothetical protein D516_3022 [Rhodobacter sp. AKP1]|nr:hypothetical protein D516_3022 [Rhodobacter sp. AKP1]